MAARRKDVKGAEMEIRTFLKFENDVQMEDGKSLLECNPWIRKDAVFSKIFQKISDDGQAANIILFVYNMCDPGGPCRMKRSWDDRRALALRKTPSLKASYKDLIARKEMPTVEAAIKHYINHIVPDDEWEQNIKAMLNVAKVLRKKLNDLTENSKQEDLEVVMKLVKDGTLMSIDRQIGELDRYKLYVPQITKNEAKETDLFSDLDDKEEEENLPSGNAIMNEMRKW